MGKFDPVSWETVEAARGPPAVEVTEYVDRMAEEVAGAEPYDAVKAIHDALYETERSVPSVAEPFITAYLLELRGVIEPDDEFESLVARHPGEAHLQELFWQRQRTLWWIGVLAGVHPSLVTFWMYEADIPLMERNFADDDLERIQRHREASEE